MYKLITTNVLLLSTAMFFIFYMYIHFRYTLCYHSFACRYKIFNMYVGMGIVKVLTVLLLLSILLIDPVL